jgi:hypothetical protein
MQNVVEEIDVGLPRVLRHRTLTELSFPRLERQMRCVD